MKRQRRGYSLYRKGGKGAWYVAWTDGTGQRRAVKGSLDKSVANEIGRAKATEADRVRAGVITTAEQTAKNAATQDIKIALDEWKSDLKNRNRTGPYIEMECNRLVALFELGGITCLQEMTVQRVSDALGEISDLTTPQTANHYRTAARMFSRWCAKTNKTVGHVLFGLDVVAAHGETFTRTPINAERLANLLSATESRKSKTPFGNKDRAMYYRVMAYTGFRRSEAKSLTPESFSLDTDPPTITVQAGYSKRRRKDVQAIPPDLAAVLKPWLSDKSPGRPVFPIRKWLNLNRLFRLDCKAAGIKAKDGEVLGVHSLRRFYITSVIRGGGLAVAQVMARHSTPKLTAKYADLDMQDIQKGLAGLPSIGSATGSATTRG